MKRMMIFTVLCLTLFSFRVCAEECFVSELGVSLTLPEGYSIMTRETVRNGSIPDDMGMSLDMMEEYLVENDIYLHAMAPDYAGEIVLTAGTAHQSMEGLAERTLEVIAEEIAAQYEENAMTVLRTTIDTDGKTPYIVFHFADGSLQYYTAKGGMAYQLTMQSTEGTIIEAQEAELKSVAGSMRFSEKKQKLATEMPPDMEVYKGEKDLPPAIPIVGIVISVIAISAVVFVAMRKKK